MSNKVEAKLLTEDERATINQALTAMFTIGQPVPPHWNSVIKLVAHIKALEAGIVTSEQGLDHVALVTARLEDKPLPETTLMRMKARLEKQIGGKHFDLDYLMKLIDEHHADMQKIKEVGRKYVDMLEKHEGWRPDGWEIMW